VGPPQLRAGEGVTLLTEQGLTPGYDTRRDARKAAKLGNQGDISRRVPISLWAATSWAECKAGPRLTSR
jgi:hypothetical protein